MTITFYMTTVLTDCMRHRLARQVFKELVTTTKWEKIVLLIPFIVLIIDADIFYYSWMHDKAILILLSSIVLVLSFVEIIAVLKEIHERIAHAQKCSAIEKKVLQAVQQFKEKPTVGQVMAMLSDNDTEKFSRFELYPVVCEVLNSLYRDGECESD